MKWLILALLSVCIILGVIIYYQSKKDAKNAKGRLGREQYILTLEGEKKAIRDSLRTSEERYNNLEKQKQKITIRYVKIKETIINSPDSVVIQSAQRDGFHVRLIAH